MRLKRYYWQPTRTYRWLLHSWLWSDNELRTEDPNEKMHSPLPSCTYRVELTGDSCRHQSEVIKEGSTVAGDQKDQQEWKRWWRWNRGMQIQEIRASAGNQWGSPNIGAMCTVIEMQGLRDELQFLDSLKYANQVMRNTGLGGKYKNVMTQKMIVTLE